MKKTVVISLLFCSVISFGQTKTNALLTSKYTGTYGYGRHIEKERIGTIFIVPETDTTILFYIDLNRGAPSYNMGSLYGRVKIVNNRGTFSTSFDSSGKGCKWTFLFSKNSLTIETVDGQDYCGFGYAVIADGVFKRTSNKFISSFEDMEGKKIYFSKTKPEDYYKE
jgi:hypothetical protein